MEDMVDVISDVFVENETWSVEGARYCIRDQAAKVLRTLVRYISSFGNFII